MAESASMDSCDNTCPTCDLSYWYLNRCLICEWHVDPKVFLRIQFRLLFEPLFEDSDTELDSDEEDEGRETPKMNHQSRLRCNSFSSQ
jgi:hypothetical protein